MKLRRKPAEDPHPDAGEPLPHARRGLSRKPGFNPDLESQLESWSAPEPLLDLSPIAEPTGPFNGYSRTLTSQGGIRFTYRDQIANTFLDIARVGTLIIGNLVSAVLVFHSPFTGLGAVLAFAGLSALVWRVARHKFIVWHSIEIHPDGMTIDGQYFFSADDIGDNWPALQMPDDNPDRLVLSGICGTRFIEYATANRIDQNDRMPEVLAADLELAMEQLWGRRDFIIAAEDD